MSLSTLNPSLVSLGGLVAGANDILEGVLERSTTNEETIDVGSRDEVVGVLVSDAAAIENASLFSSFLRDVRAEPASNAHMGLLSLLRCCDHTSADSPDWLVRNDNLAPVFNMLADGGKLASIDGVGLARLALIELLTNASHDAEILIKSSLDLLCDNLVRLAEHMAPLAVAEDDPAKAKVLQHGCASLTCISSIAIE